MTIDPSAKSSEKPEITRRSFIKASSLAGAALASAFPSISTTYGQKDLIRVGVIGCGGRGTGAALNILQAKTSVVYPPPRQGYHTEDAVPGAKAMAEGIQVVSLADLFRDRLDECRTQLARVGTEIPDSRCFVGLEAYQELLSLPDVDYVILATPPQFRPRELRAAVDAGKHVFMEKPIAVDAPGVRSVLESGELARRKGLAVGAGTLRRHQADIIETVGRIHDGAIGRIIEARAYFNVGEIWMIPREDGWSDREWQYRNWPYFTWLSGDIIVEQHIHSLDHINWLLDDHPVRAYGVGGNISREEDDFGHTYDHFAIEYEYPGGARLFSQNRQIDNCTVRIATALVGDKGTSNGMNQIEGERPWRFSGQVRDAYEQEHIDLVESIRSGSPLNEAKVVAESTLTAILGREAAYSGKLVTWDQVLQSTRNYTPETFAFGPAPFPEVVNPKRYQLS